MLFIGSFLIGAISAFVIPAPPALLPRVVEQHQLEAGNAMMQLNKALFAYVWRNVPMRAAWVLIAVINFVILGALEVGIPVLAREQLQGPISFGVIFTALGLASTAGAVVAGSIKAPRRLGWLMLAGTAWMGLGVAVIALAQTLPAVLVAMIAIGLAIGVLNTYLLSWVQRRVQPDMLGRVMSMVMLAGLGTEPIELATGGAIPSRSLTLLLWLCAASIVAVAAASTMSRSVRQMS